MKIPTPESGTPVIDPATMRIEITALGPYLVYGNIPIIQQTITNDEQGKSWRLIPSSTNYSIHPSPTTICRCGHSKNAPYCDGSHTKVHWDPTLTAPRTPLLDDAQVTQGPVLSLTDNEQYCAFTRFCDAKGRTWNQTVQSNLPQQAQLAIRTANACPAGRLKIWDNASNNPIETPLQPSIGLLEDPSIQCSGPIYVTGGIPIIDPQTNFAYQPRNRVTLCRCGNSSNKPFCDGTHASSHYHDKLRHGTQKIDEKIKL